MATKFIKLLLGSKPPKKEVLERLERERELAQSEAIAAIRGARNVKELSQMMLTRLVEER